MSSAREKERRIDKELDNNEYTYALNIKDAKTVLKCLRWSYSAHISYDNKHNSDIL